MRVGTAIEDMPPPVAPEAPLPVGRPPPTVASVAKAAVMSSLLFGGFAKKKKQGDDPPTAIDSAPGAVLIEAVT